MAIFCHVIDSGSMRQAAKNLNMTPSAVSQFITQLETELGITLIYRSTRKISLSEAGLNYYKQGQQMLLAAERADNVISEQKDSLDGELRISVPVGMATNPLAEALADLLKNQPKLNLSIIASDEYVDPIAERIDIAINVGQPADSGFIYHYLGDPARHFYASPEYLRLHGRPVVPADLEQHSWLGLRCNCALNQTVLTKAGHHSINYTPKLRMQFNDLNSMIAHVKQGLGISVLPRLEIKRLIGTGELVPVLDDWSMPGFHLYALTMDKKLSLKVKVALDTLKDYFNKQVQ